MGMGWSGRESRKQGRSGSSSGRGESGAGSGKLPLSGGASRQSQQAREDGATVGMRRKLAHVANAFGQSHGCGPAPKQALKPLGGLTARVVRVEGEEDAGAAPQGGCGLLNALGAQGGAGGKAPPGNRKPVEDALGEHRPRRSEAEPPKPKHRLGTGERLEPWGSVGVYGPPRKPPHKSPGYLWNDDHPREPLRAPLREQAGVPEPLGGEAGGLDGFAQPAPRREAEAQPQGGVHADAPGGKVPPRRRSAPKPPGVEPRRRRQQSRVPRRKNGGGRASLDGSTPPRGRRRSGGVNAAVQPPDRIGQAQALDALDEVQHVAAVTAAEAVELFGVAVHQVERLVRAGCSTGNIRAEEASGAKDDRGGLLELLDLVVEGDTLVVTHIDRLSRGLTYGLQVIEDLHLRGVEFRSLSEDFDTSTATGKLQLQMVLAFSEWWRNSIRDRSVAGQAKARAEGRFPGRRPSLTAQQRDYIRVERSKGVSQRELAKLLEVSRWTIQQVDR